MENDIVLYERERGIGLITINRPEVYNALNDALLMKLGDVFGKIKYDSEIGVIIITGAGEKAFV